MSFESECFVISEFGLNFTVRHPPEKHQMKRKLVFRASGNFTITASHQCFTSHDRYLVGTASASHLSNSTCLSSNNYNSL
ncbi:hypothetical protein HAX54_050519, partial [Datura stramonium]|nr:hypothetical protein [Datura stramonium]